MLDGTAKVKTRFPLGMGLTGSAFEKKKIVYTNKIESMALFNDDVDNVLKLKPVKNIAIYRVSAWDLSHDYVDRDNLTVGVIQMGNKKQSSSFPFITKSDIVSVLNIMRSRLL
jgi:hypothetical protein